MFPKLSEYEFKYCNSENWQNVSETLVLKKLADVFDPLTPSLTKMLQGKEITTPEGSYRIKRSGNEGKGY